MEILGHVCKLMGIIQERRRGNDRREEGNHFRNNILRQKLMELKSSLEGLNLDGVGDPSTVKGGKTVHGYR